MATSADKYHRARIVAMTFQHEVPGVVLHVDDVGTGDPGSVRLLNVTRGVEAAVGCKLKVHRETGVIKVGGSVWAEKVGPGTYRMVDPPARVAEGVVMNA